MCRYDFVSYKEKQEKLFSSAAERGIGISVFKVSAGERQKEIRNLEAGGLSFRQATVKWALSNPNVSSVCAGITSFDEIDEYCGAVGKPLEEAEAAMLERYASKMYSSYCRNCGACEPSCPHNVAIADVMRYAMYFKYYGREKDSMKLYAALPEENRADPCARCGGECQHSCPYGRAVREELLEAHEMLT
jgi:predicted aldo/keto reductase-like oxidoreductase